HRGAAADGPGSEEQVDADGGAVQHEQHVRKNRREAPAHCPHCKSALPRDPPGRPGRRLKKTPRRRRGDEERTISVRVFNEVSAGPRNAEVRPNAAPEEARGPSASRAGARAPGAFPAAVQEPDAPRATAAPIPAAAEPCAETSRSCDPAEWPCD